MFLKRFRKMYMYLINFLVTRSLQTLVDTVVKLENTTKILNDTVDSLTFDIVGVTYSPTGSESKAVVDCKAGQGMELVICSKKFSYK